MMRGECSTTDKKISVKKSLTDEVFSWSINDILSQQLFKDTVEKIPESFEGVEEYFGSFIYPLLEETRAQLSSSLENISRAPYVEVVNFVKSSEQNEELLYDIKIDYWRNTFGVCGNVSHRMFPGDVLLFTDVKPENVSDLQWLGTRWALVAQVQEHNNGDDQTATCLLVKPSADLQAHLSTGRSLFAVFLMNTRTNLRIWNSLQIDANVTLTKQILHSATERDELKCALCDSRSYLTRVEDFVRTLSSELNESQRKVVDEILCKVHCNHRSFVELIWGPPGTGKTKTLSILLFILLKLKHRTLICAPTNTAIVHVASRVLKLLKESSSYSLCDILYFGETDVAKVDPDIKEIYLDHQAKSLKNHVQAASLVFCTASSSYILQSLLAQPLNLLIVDESAQLKEAESSIPLQLPGVRHVVLFGDHNQLTAEVTSNVSAKAGFGRSLFERLISIGHSKHILNMQYRMDPSISLFPNSEFYANQIVDASNVRRNSYEKYFLPGPLFGPYSFINVSCGFEDVDSLKNMVEVSIVMKILRKLFKAWSGSKQKLSIGIISPFVPQVMAIKEKAGRKYENLDGFSLKVNTIDGFQGGEEDIIVLSTVITNADKSVGFMPNPQRTNVALTRARCCLWIVGDAKTLSGCNSVWQFIVQDAKDRQCFYDAEEDKELASVVLEVKKELDQFDDFLNGVLFKNARWKVLFSDIFRISFEKLKSSETKKLVINLIVRLSCGWRTARRDSKLICDSSSKMLKQFKVKHLHLICSIDIVKDSGHTYIQVLRVWDILPMAGIPQLVERLDSVFRTYTDDFIKRCETKCIEGDLEVPMSWSSPVHRHKRGHVHSENDSITHASEEVVFVEHCKTRDSLLLMKFYSLSTGVISHLLSGRDGNEMDFPFELTDEEKDIVLFSRSSFILGRSGTGKTTVLIMKLFQKEQIHRLALEGFHEVENNSFDNVGQSKENAKRDILRQSFVTVNPRLCYSVRQYICRLKRSTCGWSSIEGSSKTVEEDVDEISEFSDIPDSFADLSESYYPLVITFNKFLMMLNGTVGRSFFERFPELQGLHQEKRKGSRSVALKAFIRTKEVSYEKFCSSYCPHFSLQLTKQLDQSLVFTEIISHIKGGSQIGVHDDILSREDYISYSERRLSTLSQQDRGYIYDIFVEYERKKKRRGEFDLSDLVIDLHRRIREETYKGEKMDFVYIDEVQDLTQRQISLFKYICRNFEEGFVFSGDTAQTIIRGVDFRFKDIRALFYKEFSAYQRKGKGEITDVFHLSQNFRAHASVLKLANSVLELLYHFFPGSLDKLKPETSLLNGEKPVWLQTRYGENDFGVLFAGIQSNYQGFGADQVILVRDEHDKNEIFNLVGKQALVLTIMECKGLEFEDVLLYNFFSSSLLKDQWEVIYRYMKYRNLHQPLDLKSFPSFQKGKHIGLCSELKQLYVAITRTRHRLWILDKQLCSIFNYWEKLSLVEVRQLDHTIIQEIQVASSQEEWKARGIKLFHQQNYDKARFCFEKAGESYWRRWAEAAYLRCSADCLQDSKPKMARFHLTEAAHMYESIGKNESAAQCFFELGDYEKAGLIYLEKFGDSKVEEAAECFYLAGCYKRAAELYAKCSLFSKCVSVCADGKLFKMGYEYIQCWQKKNLITVQMFLKSEEIQKFLEKGAHHYNKFQDSNSMMTFVKAFQSKKIMRSFLMSVDRLDELLVLEKEWGNFSEAANVANMKGDVLLEADLLEKAGRVKEASKLILVYVFYNSLWVQKSKGWPLKQFGKKEEYLTKAIALAKKVSSNFSDFISSEATLLFHEKGNLFKMKRNWSVSGRHGSVRGKILCARKILDLFPDISQNQWEGHFLVDLINYSQNRKLGKDNYVENLLFYWNFWKQEIEKILSHLQGHRKEDSYTEFCHNYFGVNRLLKNEKVIYLLLYPDAEWVKSISPRHIKREGNLTWTDAEQFAHAAKIYWSSEIVTAGGKVLEILEALYGVSVKNWLSLNCQCMLLVKIFQIAKRLIDLENLNCRGDGIGMLQRFLEIPVNNFLGLIYSLNCQKSLTVDMIDLRETELSLNLLWEIASQILSSRTPKSEEIGKLVTIVLTVRFPSYLYKEIAANYVNCEPWKLFMENLRRMIGTDILRNSVINDSTEDCDEEAALVQKFQSALKGIDYADFSPSCFLYLVDRLLIMVSYLKGYFFASRSSLVDWLIFMRWNVNPNLKFVPDVHSSLAETVDFVAHTVEKLLCQEENIVNWIKKYNLKMNCYPLLVLRLFVILSLLCINFGGYCGLFLNLLSKREVTSLLPWKFYKPLQRLTKHDKAEIKIEVVAEAMEHIENPLVMVNMGLQFSFPRAIFLNLNVEQQRDSILNALYVKNNMVLCNKTTGLGREQSRSRQLCLMIKDQWMLPTWSFVLDQKSETGNQGGTVGAQRNNKNFWMNLGLVVFKMGSQTANFLADVSRVKEIVLEYILLVNAAMQHSCRSNCFDRCQHPFELINEVLDELQQLYSALDSSELGDEHIRITQDLVKKLQWRRDIVEPVMDQLLKCYGNKIKDEKRGNLKSHRW